MDKVNAKLQGLSSTDCNFQTSKARANPVIKTVPDSSTPLGKRSKVFINTQKDYNQDVALTNTTNCVTVARIQGILSAAENFISINLPLLTFEAKSVRELRSRVAVRILLFESPIIPSLCSPNFAQRIVFKFSWKDCIFPRAFENKNFGKFWLAKRVYRWFSRYVIAAMLVDGKQKIALFVHQRLFISPMLFVSPEIA